MYRGIGVVAFRNLGFTEGKVALWTTMIFAVWHSTNLITEGPTAPAQVVITAVAGCFFYLIHRVSGTLRLGMLVHGLWDFGRTSSVSGTTPNAPGIALFGVLADMVLAVITLTRRRHIEVTAGPR